MTSRWTAVLLICALASPAVFAASDSGPEDVTGSKALYEIGFHVGDILPNQIAGMTEITGVGGLRGGFRIAPQTYCEAGMIMGNGGGVQWKDAHIDARMDIPVEGLVGLAYVGADTIYYQGVGTGTRVLFGGHVGGGIQALMTGALWFRGDMKFNFNPGTSLYIGAGFEFRFGG